MRILLAAGLACATCALVQCTPRLFNPSSDDKKPSGSPTKKPDNENQTPKSQDGSTTGGTTTAPTPTLVQINPKAFNAFNIWRDGQGSEIVDYPQGYNFGSFSTTPDGVFCVNGAAYWNDNGFIGVPTEGAKVVNDVLEYPVKNGKQLKLKFTKISEKEMVHHYAVTYCKDQGLRLPTVRELFDFCAAGVTEPNYGPNYGPNFEDEKYPSTARCWKTYLWSASVFSYSGYGVWRFHGSYGFVSYGNRDGTGGVRCVGGE
jgi:hypothetical protein